MDWVGRQGGQRKDRQVRERTDGWPETVEKQKKRLGRDFFSRDGITVARELLGKILVHETSLGTVRGIITEVESYMGEEDKGSHTYGGKRTDRTEPMYHAGGTSYVYLIYGMYSCMNIAAMTEGIPQAVLLRSVIPADRESEERMCALRLAETERKRCRRAERAGQRDEEAGSVADSLVEREEAGVVAGSPAEEGEAGIVADGPAKEGEAGIVADGPAEEGEAGIVAGSPAEGEAAGSGKAGAAECRIPVGKQLPPSLRKHLADGPGKLCIAMQITRSDNDVDMTKSETFYVTEGIEVQPEQIQTGKRIGIDYAEEAADYLWRFYLEKGAGR